MRNMRSRSPRPARTVPVGSVSSVAFALTLACTPSRPPEGAPEAATTPDYQAIMRRVHTYYTGGVHNDKDCHREGQCVYPRQQGEPTDPLYPEWWTSEWTMYRVFRNYDTYPPPYASPPAGLTPSDYEVSHGATYYDSTYVPADHDGEGAMMEHYDKQCLPIFPSSNDYTCSFVSLGNKAYFLRYDDRPADTPACCQFSLDNHPPRRDFIQHLPYNPQQSQHLESSIQAYSITVPPGILFGYSFYATPAPDSANPALPPYRHPQSFFFSGSPTVPPDAPIVSQNYDNFRAQKPTPAQTWDQVASTCPKDPPWCCLFETDCPLLGEKAVGGPAAARTPAPSWADMEPRAE
jgi:hypothetical protein